MAKIYVTLEVNAKDKLDACIAVKNAIEKDKSIQLYRVASSDPYEELSEDELDKLAVNEYPICKSNKYEEMDNENCRMAFKKGYHLAKAQ